MYTLNTDKTDKDVKKRDEKRNERYDFQSIHNFKVSKHKGNFVYLIVITHREGKWSPKKKISCCAHEQRIQNSKKLKSN